MDEGGDNLGEGGILTSEPLVDAKLLVKLRELDLPFRGDIRQQALDEVIEEVRQRRTPKGVADRIKKETVDPVSERARRGFTDKAAEKMGERLEKSFNQ